MKRVCVILIALCMVLSIVACQETPDRQVVVGKNKGEFENAMSDEWDGQQSINAPERCKDHYDKYDGKVKMDIDAEVIVSDVTKYPVAEIKPYYIPIEQANRIIKSIFGTKDLHLAGVRPTKAEIEQSIMEKKAAKVKAKKDGDHEYIEELDTGIAILTEWLKDAPISMESSKYDGKYTIEKGEDIEIHRIDINSDFTNSSADFCIFNMVKSGNDHGFRSSVTYWVMTPYVIYQYEECMKAHYQENPIFQSEKAKAAIQTADQFLKAVGIEGRVLTNMMAKAKDSTGQEIVSYQLTYSKQFNDIVIPSGVQRGGSISRDTPMQEQKVYTEPYQTECLIIEVQEDKIIEMQWENIYEVGDILKDNVRLLPFDEIIANAENQLAVKYACIKDIEDQKSFFVDKIILTYAVEPIKNERYRYMLVPVWAFYGGTDYGDGSDRGDGVILKGKHPLSSSLLTVNAVDGSIIRDH